jgi:hypothetical protein
MMGARCETNDPTPKNNTCKISLFGLFAGVDLVVSDNVLKPVLVLSSDQKEEPICVLKHCQRLLNRRW